MTVTDDEIDAALRQERATPAPAGSAPPSGGGVFDEAEFWEARPELIFIRDGARAYMASPWAVLAYVALIMVGEVSPKYVLPPIVGGYASLNQYFALVGSTGVGKNSAMRVAKLLVGAKAYTRQMSTGEGIVATYVEYDSVEEVYVQKLESAIFECDEVDRYAALTKRKDATLDGIIRTMWNGDDVGQQNATKDLLRHLSAHTYRLGVVLGVQPSRGDALMSMGAVSGGTTGRFCWVPAADPGMPDLDDLPPRPETCLSVDIPEPRSLNEHGVFPIPVHPIAERAVKEDRLARVRGLLTDDVNAHGMLIRLKLATFLGVLFGHIGVGKQEWELAGYWMRQSCGTRDSVVDQLRRDAASKATARGLEQAQIEITSEEVKDEAGLKSARASILARLRKEPGEWIAWNDLYRSVRSTYRRKHARDVIEALVTAGQVERRDVEYHTHSGGAYRLIEGVTP